MAEKYGTFDNEGFYNAINSTRQSRNLTWKQVATETGVSASTLTRMAQGKRPDVDGLAALLSWSGLKADGFLLSDSVQSEPEPLAMVSTYLRAHKNLTPEGAAALDQVVRATYEALKISD